MKKVVDLKIEKGIKVKELIESFSNIGGFNAQHLYEAYLIFKKFLKEKNCLKFLSFTGNIISTGVRGVIKEMLKRKMFDVVITTCGSLDHDLARSFSNYYCGTFFVDDKKLLEKKIHRLGNVFIPFKNYGEIIEKKMREFLKRFNNIEISTYEFCWELGKFINKEDSFLFWAYKNKIPVVVPGIFDGAVGYQIWLNSQTGKGLKINLLKDESLLSDLVWNYKKSAALIIGGGISKHHTIWWNQFKNGLDYAIYITTAIESDGSLSGARTREAISWNKIGKFAKHVNIEGDATIILPILFSSVLE